MVQGEHYDCDGISDRKGQMDTRFHIEEKNQNNYFINYYMYLIKYKLNPPPLYCQSVIVICIYDYRWAALKDALLDNRFRLGEAQSLQQFCRDADEMDIWMGEKMQMAMEESYKDPTNIQSKHQKHQVLFILRTLEFVAIYILSFFISNLCLKFKKCKISAWYNRCSFNKYFQFIS